MCPYQRNVKEMQWFGGHYVKAENVAEFLACQPMDPRSRIQILVPSNVSSELQI
jgi:hypothetical protein